MRSQWRTAPIGHQLQTSRTDPPASGLITAVGTGRQVLRCDFELRPGHEGGDGEQHDSNSDQRCFPPLPGVALIGPR
jgi:hypothetical protein